MYVLNKRLWKIWTFLLTGVVEVKSEKWKVKSEEWIVTGDWWLVIGDWWRECGNVLMR